MASFQDKKIKSDTQRSPCWYFVENTILIIFPISNRRTVQVYAYYQRVSNSKSNEVMNDVPSHSMKTVLLHFKIVAFLQYEVFAYWRALLRYWIFLYPFILAQWKKVLKFFFVQRIPETQCCTSSEEAEPCFLTLVYGFMDDIKKIYSKNHFARAFSSEV